MRYAIVSNDTRGGIQPYVALGVGLLRAGHDVRIVAPQNYADFITGHGLAFHGLFGDVQSFMEGPEYKKIAEKGLFAAQSLMMRKASELIHQWTRECLAACEGTDAILAGIGGLPMAESVAEKLGTKFVQAHVQPLTPTGAFLGPLGPMWLSRLGSAGNRLSHAITRQVMWQPLRPAVNAARRSILGLPPAPFWGRVGMASQKRGLVLYGYSRHVLPKPRDWSEGVHVTGYWFLDEEETWQPPVALSEFLNAGPTPIVVGFGSMGHRDPEATAALIVEAVQATGQRAVLLSGWGGLKTTELPRNMLALNSVPHSWLFPRSSLVVHHGGAGTTGAVFRAGVPGVVVPFSADQPYWGKVVADIGCGPNPIPRRKLTGSRLAAAITEGLSERTRQRASEVGARVREEDGVQYAVERLG